MSRGNSSTWWRGGRGPKPGIRVLLSVSVLVGVLVLLVAVYPAPAGSAPAGSAPAGSAPAGSAPAGSAPAGSAPARPLSFKATGYFHVGHAGGRSWLVTPTGQPFFSTGIDHVTAANDVDQTTGKCPYCETIAGEYPSTAAWATATVARLRSWGFNSLGPFSDNSTFAPAMPYSVQLSMASGDDWFAPSFVANADAVAAAQVAPLAGDPNLIGFYTDSELHWGPDGSDTRPVLDNYLALPAGSPGLAVAEQYEGNPNGFVYALATRYFQVTTAAVRAYDRHHLILGVKAEAQEIQPELLEAARPYVDVFSIDDYTLKPGFAQIIDRIWPQYLPVTDTFDDFERYVKRPIMVGEYSFIASGPSTPDTVPQVYAVYPNQEARAAAYAAYIAPLYLDARWVVGDEWFEYVDEPQGGRVPDGENNNFGVVNVGDQPYQDLVETMESTHSIAPDRLVQHGPTCDSWARGPAGTACTAQMGAEAYPLRITTTTLSGGTEGERTTDDVVAIGGRPGYTFALGAGQALPRGLRLEPKTGAIAGTPRVPGTFSVDIEVTDSTTPVPETASQAVTITIAPHPLVIDSTRLHPIVADVGSCRTLLASGGLPPLSWSVSSGALPAGMALKPDGEVTGTPGTVGTYSFSVTVTDASTPPIAATSSETLDVVGRASEGRGFPRAGGDPLCRR